MYITLVHFIFTNSFERKFIESKQKNQLTKEYLQIIHMYSKYAGYTQELFALLQTKV